VPLSTSLPLEPTLVTASATQLASTTAVSIHRRKARECTPSRIERRSPSRNVGECFSQDFCWLVVGRLIRKPIHILPYEDHIFLDLAVSETAKRDACKFGPVHLQRIAGGHRFPLGNLP
jgi:hypothetical protein